jgi:hypothetical protein
MELSSTGLADAEPEADLFELANLYPRTTGLPMTIWASPRGRARHDARIKVCMTPGDRRDASTTAVVAARPVPDLVHGTLAPADLAAVRAWVALNTASLLDYWDGAIDTLEFVQRLRPI